MPEQRSPEALRTWAESLASQIDHCKKEMYALYEALDASAESRASHECFTAYYGLAHAGFHFASVRNRLLRDAPNVTDPTP